jgi:hypothetical protein
MQFLFVFVWAYWNDWHYVLLVFGVDFNCVWKVLVREER